MIMNEKTEKIVKYFKRYNGIARFSSMRKTGIHPDSIKKAENEGVIEKIGRGLYKLTTNTIESHSDYLLASLQTSKGVICLISALYFHGVTDEIPRVVDMAIPTGARANKIEYPPVQFYRFSQPSWKTGVETHEIEGHKIQTIDYPVILDLPKPHLNGYPQESVISEKFEAMINLGPLEWTTFTNPK